LEWMVPNWGGFSPAQAGEHERYKRGKEHQETGAAQTREHEQDRRQTHTQRDNDNNDNNDNDDNDDNDDNEAQNRPTPPPATPPLNGGGNAVPPPAPPTIVSTPTIVPPMAVIVEAMGFQTPVALGLATATDNTGVPLIVTNDAPTLFDIGTSTVTYSATDAAGNAGLATQIVTVVDTTPPVILVPVAVIAEATATTSPIMLGSTTAHDLVDGTIAVTSDAPPLFPVGTTTVTYTATDAAGNTATATQTVTVTDSTPPSLTAPPDVIVEANNVFSSVSLGSAAASDLVDGMVTVSSNGPAAFPRGSTTVTYTARDAAGNTATAAQQVAVSDTTPPTVIAPQTTTIASLDGSAVAIALSAPLGSDIFGPVQWSNDAPSQFIVGDTVVTWTARDANGNTATTTQTVTVLFDPNAPPTTAATLPVDTMPLPPTVLPPDPGAAGRATLEGIDSDGDGVRDDVQIWIETNYPNSLKIRMALRQEAITFQNYLEGFRDPDLTFINLQEHGRSIMCLFQVIGLDAPQIRAQLKAIILNTTQRSKALFDADSHISGMIIGLPNDLDTVCDFTPVSLQN